MDCKAFTGLKYPILRDQDAYPKFDYEIASLNTILYERVKVADFVRFWSIKSMP